MDAGLRIKELARLAGLSEMTIVNWEQGRARPKEYGLTKVIAALKKQGNMTVCPLSFM